MQVIEKEACINFGGIDKIWIAKQKDILSNITKNQSGTYNVLIDANFTLIEFEEGRFEENIRASAQGHTFTKSIRLRLGKKRATVLDFEDDHRQILLTAVITDQTGASYTFQDLQLDRTFTSEFGTNNGQRFDFSLTGNGIDRSLTSNPVEALFSFTSNFNPGSSTFDPAIISTLLGTEWIFQNGKRLQGNAISTDGILQGLDGNTQSILIDADSGSLDNITELYFRDDSITGSFELGEFNNLVKADLALNNIESITVGDWVNNSGVVIELRGNKISSANQKAIVEAVANRFTGTSSDLKIGLLNQENAGGSAELPDNDTIVLARSLFDNYGIEIHLMGIQIRAVIS